ncbi:MAG: hypothetical protein PHI64_19630 [Zoogloea sp.]|uniref:hypothetical protein n=1 Tax=Zoogloea sp. TaxID=49181 RepID=UPI0026081A92|nr:hypothetical protein [Zoogloea sp.]MDD2991151.1 hypothetical protein [Zoogloea sp.]
MKISLITACSEPGASVAEVQGNANQQRRLVLERALRWGSSRLSGPWVLIHLVACS